MLKKDNCGYSGYALSGISSFFCHRFSGADIIKSISMMHDRSNGLGYGFAAYGIYPKHKDYHAFHLFYDNMEAKENRKASFNRHFEITHQRRSPQKNTMAP
jgi:glutamate synthase domain-containing protein 1